jgi:hypothetical protein
MPPILSRVLAAVVAFAALGGFAVTRYVGPLPHPFHVELILDRGVANRAEPVIVSGRVHSGDFLVLKYLDESHVAFGYNSWGHPGLISPTAVKVTPGVPLRLKIEMPSLNQTGDRFTPPPGRIRVTCDGIVVLDLEDHYFTRRPEEIYLGENPLGGTACGPRLHGRLVYAGGRELRGSAGEFLTLPERIDAWFRHSTRPYALLVLLVLIVSLPRRVLRLSGVRTGLASAAGLLREHRAFAITAGVCSAVFAWMITTGTLRFSYPEELGSFYDYQAQSLLNGRLDVPGDAIGGEAFRYGGKIYGYFGPTPALLRMPSVILEYEFGQLTRGYMLAYFIAGLTAAYLLLLQAFRLAGAKAPPSPWIVVLFLSHVGLGSTLFFLGSRAYVFHEAILCGAVFALFSCHLALHHLATPARRWWLWALVCGLLSLHARPPTGLFALTFLGCVAAAQLFRELRRGFTTRLLPPVGIGLLCVVGVFTFNALGYLKFESFDGAPLRYSQPYGPERLAKIDGKNFHAANISYGFYSYLMRPHFRGERRFPWIYLGSPHPAPAFPKAKIDLPDHTLAIPWSMPGLFLLSTLGCAAAFVVLPTARRALVVAWVAVLPMSVALFAAIATAQRYTGDWIPFLVCAAALGLAALETAPPRLRLALRTLLFACTLAAVLLTFALTLHYQRETVWGVAEEVRQSYQNFRTRLTP